MLERQQNQQLRLENDRIRADRLEKEAKEGRENKKSLQEEIENLGFDPLTGVLSRGKCEDGLKSLLERLYGEQKPGVPAHISVLFVDLDHFKAINDTYDHAKADEVLQVAAQALRSSVVRKDDIVGRWGGEEFIVVLSGTTETMAAQKAEELRHKIEQLRFAGEPKLQVTASFGVATADRMHPRTLDELVKAADDAMYFSKDAGRNRVTTESRRETEESRQGGLDFGDTGKMNS